MQINYAHMKEIAKSILDEISHYESRTERQYHQRKLVEAHPQAHRPVIRQYINNIKKERGRHINDRFNSFTPLY